MYSYTVLKNSIPPQKRNFKEFKYMKKNKLESRLFVDNIYCEIYDVILNVIADNSVYLALKQMKRLEGRREADLANTKALFWVNKTNHWQLVFDLNQIDCRVIAHECFHATKRVLESKDIYLNCQTEEAYAYLLDWLVGKTTELLKDFIK